jgi:type VII secretion integral membrane protein EccD
MQQAPPREDAAPARRFTRITIVAPTRRADLSVPDDLPVALLVEQARPLLEAGAGDRWVLTHPAAGDLDPDTALRDAGVLDGALLYLRKHGDGYVPPYAEDAAEDAAAGDRRQGTWTEGATRLVLAASAALWLGLTGPLLVWWFGPTAAAGPVLVLVAALVAGGAVAHLSRRELVGAALGWALLPAALSAAAALTAAAGLAVMVAAAAGAVAAAAVVVGLLLSRRQHRLGWAALVGTVTVTLTVQLWAGLAASGLTADRAAAAVALLLVAVQSGLPRIATELAGLGRLADTVAEGGAVRSDRIQIAADQARATLAALLAGTGIAAVLAVHRLAGEGGATGALLGVLVSVAVLLRARRYSGTGHVLPLVAGGLAGLLSVAAAHAGGDGTAAMTLLSALVVGVVLVTLSAAHPTAPTRARGRIMLERAETAVLVGCGVAALAAFDAYGFAYAVVR